MIEIRHPPYPLSMEVKGEKRGGGLGWKILSGYEHGFYLYVSDSIYDFGVFLKNGCKVAKLKDDIIKHRLNPIASIKTLVRH